MAVNKVVYDGNTLIDLTNSTVSADTLAQGVSAYAADGSYITGVAPTTAVLYTAQSLTGAQQQQARNNIGIDAATTSTAGLMTASDKAKLDSIAAGANAYTLPTASSSTLGGVKTTSTVTSNSGYTACPIIGGVPYYKDTNTTYSLGSFGVTATAAELNYVDGVTSNVQTQLNGKLSTSGTAYSTARVASDVLTTGTSTTSITVSGSGYVSQKTFAAPTISGYTLVAAISWSSNSSYLFCYHMYHVGTTFGFSCRNTKSSEVTATITIRGLYMKTS